MVGGGLTAIPSLALVSEGIPNAPFTGYSGADLTLAEGRERGVMGGLTGGGLGTDCGGETDGADEITGSGDTTGAG